MRKGSPGQPDSGVRLLLLVRKLLAGQALTSHDVVHEFGVSIHTAGRDIAMLGMYLPLEIKRTSFGAQGGRSKVVRLAR